MNVKFLPEFSAHVSGLNAECDNKADPSKPSPMLKKNGRGSGPLEGLPQRAIGRWETTFLTVEKSGRAPSAYHVDDQGYARRARQEHREGPINTSARKRAHAFVPSEKQQIALCAVVEKDAVELNIAPDDALRLAIMDRLASPVAVANSVHAEAINQGVHAGNPHRSGGVVKFAEPGSALADFASVSRNIAKIVRGRGKPLTDTATDIPTPAAEAFNERALKQQRIFAKKFVFKPSGAEE